MKKLLLSVMCFFSLIFTGCSGNYIKLELEYQTLSILEKTLQEEYDELADLVGDKSSQEIIDIINELNEEVIKSNVMITNESQGYFNSTSISSGSGTIIKEDDTKYYVLTNNHVIYTLNSSKTNYYIYDYLNNEYNATVEFYNPNYDMALLSFNKETSDLRVAKLAIKDPEVGDNLITIGQPLGKRNIITFGEVTKYDYVDCANCVSQESNIRYQCVYYDAITLNGNSGGMIINFDYELIGVVTFGFTTNGVYTQGAGSPISRVRSFLSNNDFEVGDYNE